MRILSKLGNLFGNLFGRDKKDNKDIIDILKNDQYDDVHRIISEINDNAKLYEIVKNTQYDDAREIAISEITDENILSYIVRDFGNKDGSIAISKIIDNDILLDIAKNNKHEDVRKIAIEKIKDEKALIDIAKNSEDNNLRSITIDKILSIEESEKKSIRERFESDAVSKKNIHKNELSEIANRANGKLIFKIIDGYEDIERLVKIESNDIDSLKEGLEIAYSKLKNTLEKEGLKEIPTKNIKSDYNLHTVFSTEKNDNHEDGYIIEELSKGYTFKGKMIKESVVKVCKNNNR
jgi:molecular chaperone GrpE